MRVATKTIEDFIENLGTSDVFDSAVYVDVLRNTVNDGATYHVTLQAAAVMRTKGDEEFLLQLGCNCGIDDETKFGHPDGSKHASEIKHKLKEYCETRGLELRPGILSE
jgi:hypothetical protein